MRSHGEGVGAWPMDKDIDKIKHLPKSNYDRHLFPDAPLDDKRAVEERINLQKYIPGNRSVAENKYRSEIFHMMEHQKALEVPIETVTSNTAEPLDNCNSNRRVSTVTTRKPEVQSNDAVDFSKPGPTPWITNYHVKGMQRSMRVERSEIINILKLELFAPPIKALESRAQRDRRAARRKLEMANSDTNDDAYSDNDRDSGRRGTADSSSGNYRGNRHSDAASVDLSSSYEDNASSDSDRGSGRRDRKSVV